jgi:hypothetical protein
MKPIKKQQKLSKNSKKGDKREHLAKIKEELRKKNINIDYFQSLWHII